MIVTKNYDKDSSENNDDGDDGGGVMMILITMDTHCKKL
jgi:hypothetical protein